MKGFVLFSAAERAETKAVLLLYNVLHKTFAIANKFNEVMPRSQESKIYGLIGFNLGMMMQSATRILDKHLNF